MQPHRRDGCDLNDQPGDENQETETDYDALYVSCLSKRLINTWRYRNAATPIGLRAMGRSFFTRPEMMIPKVGNGPVRRRVRMF